MADPTKIEVGSNLNKMNFFNRMEDEFPKATQDFLDWIDEYKVKVKWKTMFFKTKFHDLPFELQFGLFVQYMFERRMGDGMMFDFDYNTEYAITVKTFAKKFEYGLSKLEVKL